MKYIKYYQTRQIGVGPRMDLQQIGTVHNDSFLMIHNFDGLIESRRGIEKKRNHETNNLYDQSGANNKLNLALTSIVTKLKLHFVFLIFLQPEIFQIRQPLRLQEELLRPGLRLPALRHLQVS